MAGLNLVPNPTFVVIQFGIFLTALAIVKKYFLKPYLKVQLKREELTHGLKVQAEETFTKNTHLSADIDKKVDEVIVVAKKDSEQIKISSKKQADQVIAQAESDSRQDISSVLDDLNKEIDAARSQIPAVVKTLTQEIYAKLM